MRPLGIGLLALCSLLLFTALPAQNVVYFPDNALGTPGGNYPWYTGGTPPVRHQQLVPGTFAGLPTRPMLLTRIGWALQEPAAATSATYSTFEVKVGNAGVSSLTNTWNTNLPDQTIRFKRTNFVVAPGPNPVWWELELDVPLLYDGKSGLVLDLITAATPSGTYCRMTRDATIQRMLLANYQGQPTGGTPSTGGGKLKLTFEECRGPLGKVLQKAVDLQSICLLPTTPPAGNAGLLGLAYGPGAAPTKPGEIAKNYLWVTGRRNTAVANSPHFLYQVDVHATAGPTLVATYNQPTTVNASSWGLRDLAYDTANHLLYGGTDVNAANPGRLYAFDCVALAWDATKDVLVPGTALTCLRALAIDSAGRKFYAANFTSAIEQIDAGTGAVLATYTAAQHGATGMYGLGFLDLDGKTPRLWSFGDGTTAWQAGVNPLPGSRVVLKEHDLKNNLALTQVRTFADTGVPYVGTAYPDGGIVGGMEIAWDEVHRQPVIWSLHQGDPVDMASVVNPIWLFGGACSEGSGRIPVPGMANDVPYAGNLQWALTIGNLQSSASGLVMAGLSDVSWSGIPLPWNLTFLGLPGCWINASFDLGLGSAAVAGGTVTVPVPIPANPVLRGSDLFFQWILLDKTVPSNFLTSFGSGARIQ